MDNFAILSILLWSTSFIVLLKSFLDHIYLWQIKEYRLDRMKSFLTFNLKFRNKIITFTILKLAVIISAIWLLIDPNYINLAVVIIDLAVNVYLTSVILQHLIYGKNQLPKKSIRNVLIMLFTIFITFLPIIYIYTIIKDIPTLEEANPLNYNVQNLGKDLNDYIRINNSSTDTKLQTIDLSIFILSIITIYNSLIYFLSFPLTTLAVLFTHPLSKYRRYKIVQKAKQKINKMPDLKVIGITGSYGKTSTKEMLVKLLSKKYKVGFTPENNNTEVGIALSILKKLPKDSEIFVMEVGAYQKGEIAKCVDISKLDFAIVVNVGKAHLDIFKTIENIAEAKTELLGGLKPRGKAILNYDNNFTKEMAGKTLNENFFYHVADEEDHSKENINKLLSISDIVWNEPQVKFTLKFGADQIEMYTKVIGKHQLRNLAAALLCAHLIGVSFKELQHHLEKMTFESTHFRIYTGNSGVKIIDDGYNSNPEGFTSALSHLKISNSQTKIIISRGIPELGKEMKSIYSTLTEEIYATSNIFITSDPTFYEIIKAGKPAKLEVFYIDDNVKLKKLIKKYLNDKTTILIEGRIHPKILNFIQNSN